MRPEIEIWIYEFMKSPRLLVICDKTSTVRR
jgi:hypothetical protein